ncbi:hypothetical protein ATK36_0107 [Amycolatopsis sulphurea]|uniref:Transglycosylase SLT domain-containing protein n=1 Tax=Amycolatopsis sulphurea TaxID=76022 RepID=A0A2A9FZK8_9PSEU|nr:hypothetical protein [Amycolatopsis sulphurea]PFG56588.1 hypothetical protein ATK36_0107 [Amycolatopsis sulphurea]
MKLSRRVSVLSGLLVSGAVLAAPMATASTAEQQRGCAYQSTLAGTQLSDVQLAQQARNAGLHGQSLVLSVAVGLAESAGWTHAQLTNTDCSRDRGLWQISDRWHPEVSDGQAFDPVGAARAMYAISSHGSNWSPWVAYNNGSYQQYMSRAQAAAGQAGG